MSDPMTIPTIDPKVKADYEKSLEDYKTIESARQRGLFEQDQGRKEAARIAEEIQSRFGMSVDEIPAFIEQAVPQNEQAMRTFTKSVDQALVEIAEINRLRTA